jgi:hypothetical protein
MMRNSFFFDILVFIPFLRRNLLSIGYIVLLLKDVQYKILFFWYGGYKMKKYERDKEDLKQKDFGENTDTIWWLESRKKTAQRINKEKRRFPFDFRYMMENMRDVHKYSSTKIYQ